MNLLKMRNASSLLHYHMLPDWVTCLHPLKEGCNLSKMYVPMCCEMMFEKVLCGMGSEAVDQ